MGWTICGRALSVSLEHGLTREAEIGYHNLGSWLWLTQGADEALPYYAAAVEFYERRGRESHWSRGEMTWPLFDVGRWDELLELARSIEEEATGRQGQPLLMALASKARVLFYRGRPAEAQTIAAELLPRARAVGDPQILLPALSLAALVEPDAAVAIGLIEDMLAVDAPENPLYPDSARVCVRHGSLELAERMIRSDERAAPRTRHVGATVAAIVAEARGEHDEAVRLYEEAAERWQEYPFALERGLCLLGAGQLEEAAAILRSLGAEALMAAA